MLQAATLTLKLTIVSVKIHYFIDKLCQQNSLKLIGWIFIFCTGTDGLMKFALSYQFLEIFL